MKNFKKNGGFTLVELIVVIAVLAILAAVAIPAYGGYVTKANKQMDTSLASEIGDALLMGYYDGSIVLTADAPVAYVVIGPDGTIVDKSDAAVEALVNNYFPNRSLKYNGWDAVNASVNYMTSSFVGQEKALLTEVSKLTGTLGKVMTGGQVEGLGAGLQNFMTNKKLDVNDPTQVGNAAVLYIAEQTTNKNNSDLILNTINEALDTGDQSKLGDAVSSLSSTIGTAAAMAAVYSIYEGYAQYSGQAAILHDGTTAAFNDVKNVQDVMSSLNGIGLKMDGFDLYMKNQGKKDLAGYMEVMSNVHLNEDAVKNDLSKHDCFTNGKMESALTGMGSAPISVGKECIGIALYLSNVNGQPIVDTILIDAG